MRRKRQTQHRQVPLFPAVVQRDAMPIEAKREIVSALADLLLQALKAEMNAEGGCDDEPEDHV